MQLPPSQLAVRAAVSDLVRRRTLVIVCAVVPWVVTIVRSWPASEPAREAPRASPAPVVDRWAACPPVLDVFRKRTRWTLLVNRYEQLYVVTAHERPAVMPSRPVGNNGEFELEPVHRRAILDRLLAACEAGNITVGQSTAMQFEEPTIVFAPASSSRVTMLIGSTVLYVDGYGAIAR